MDFFHTEFPDFDPNRRETTDGMDDPQSLTNQEKADSAESCFSAKFLRSQPWGKEDISDLISNILHLAHSLDIDPVETIESALRDFTAEAGPLDAAEATL